MLLLPIGGAALLLLQQLLPPSARPEDVARFGWLLLNLSAFLASLAVIVAPHEAAHALVARVLGLRVFSVTLGIGPKLFETLLGRTRLRVNALPIAGLTMVGQRHTRWMRARVFLLTLAGPLANLVLLLASLRLTHSAALLSDLELALDFALANAFVLVANLIPYRVKANGLGTDGWMLLNVCCFWGQREVDEHAAGAYAMEAHTENQAGNLPAALDWVREGLGSYPESALLSMTEGYLRVYTAEYEQARNSFLRALASPVIAPELRALAQNNLAWVNLVTSPDGRLSEANQASREACERLG